MNCVIILQQTCSSYSLYLHECSLLYPIVATACMHVCIATHGYTFICIWNPFTKVSTFLYFSLLQLLQPELCQMVMGCRIPRGRDQVYSCMHACTCVHSPSIIAFVLVKRENHAQTVKKDSLYPGSRISCTCRRISLVTGTIFFAKATNNFLHCMRIHSRSLHLCQLCINIFCCQIQHN